MNKIVTAMLCAVGVVATAAQAQTAVTFVDGRLAVLTNGANQSAKVEVTPAGGVRLFGFAGVADGASYFGVSAIAVTTGSGADKLEFDIQSSQSLSVALNTGAGDAETVVKWKVLPGGTTPNVRFDLASRVGGNQLANIEIDSEATGAAVAVTTGNANEANVKVISDDPSEFLGVTLVSRARKTALDVTSGAARTALDLRGAYTIFPNEVKYNLSQVQTGVVTVATDVTLASGNDLVEANISAPGSTVQLTGNIRGGAGDDLILIDSAARSTIVGLTVAGGIGNDFLDVGVVGRFQLSQTLGARLLGGDGNDTLILTTDTAIVGTGLPNDVIPVIDGGPGFDLFFAFGQILNCEGRL